jgi:hypothetical protein
MEKALQQSLGGLGVAANLNDIVENVAVLVDRAPEIALLAVDVDRDDDLIEMPAVMPAGLLALQAASVIGAEFHGPATDGFIGENYPALEQHLLYKTQAEWKSEVETDGVGDDLGREAMALVAHGRWVHAA